MKKFLFHLTLTSLVLLSLFTRCKKSINDPTDETVSRAVPNESLPSQCRLTRFTYPGFDNVFHYNEKGLADEWKIDGGLGFNDVYSMEYDNNNRLKKAWWHIDGGLVAIIDFSWTGNLITQEHWDFDGFSFDMANTYDRKGQLVKRETSYGLAGSAEYSPIGNATVFEISFDDELLEKHEMTHNTPNRNPFLAIRGIPYGFPYIMVPFSRWWETSEKVTFYEAGTPIVALDPDPSQTTMQFGFQQYLSQVNYFDLATNSHFSVPFEYENCGANSNGSTIRTMPASPNIHTGSKANTVAPLRIGPPDFIKAQITKIRNRIK